MDQQTFQDGACDVPQKLQTLTEKTIVLPLKDTNSSWCQSNGVDRQGVTL